MTHVTRFPLSDNWFDPKTSVVYRAFAENGDLLYVGVTYNPCQRFYMHEWHTFWWHDVDRVDISQEFMDRWVAEDAESKAIRDFEPLHNVQRLGVPARSEDIALVFEPYPYVNGRRASLLALFGARPAPSRTEAAS